VDVEMEFQDTYDTYNHNKVFKKNILVVLIDRIKEIINWNGHKP
jgi:hypothetical protein